jgi:Cu+-exporting ATPase
MAESFGVQVSSEWEQRLTEFDQLGQSPLFVALIAGVAERAADQAATESPQILGLIGIRDTPRSEGMAVIHQLKALGIRSIALLTGDRRNAAHALASGIAELDEVQAEQLPADKAHWIEREVAAGRRVAMIGDGVNDAPALAAATVGLALGKIGSDLAAEAGDVILMGDPLAPLPGLLRLSRQMVRVIRQGIYLFAFGVNGLGVVLCAWGLLDPVGGAIFHELASLAVMLNSLRLLWFERWDHTALGKLASDVLNATECLAESLSPTQMIQWLVIRRNVVMRLAAAFVGMCYLASNCIVLSADEEALVTRFGRYETTLGAGLHWRWPAPLEKVRLEKVHRLRSIQIGFRAERGAVAARGMYVKPVEWQAEHAERSYRPMPEESSLLAGDEVALDLTAEAHYRVIDLREYVEGTNDPTALLLAAAEGATRQVVAARKLDEILAEYRAEVEAECLRALREAIASYRLGVEIASFTLLDVHPPTTVVPAYRDVANAMEEREQSINLAEVQYARRVLSTGGERAIRALGGLDHRATNSQRAESTSGGVADWTLTDGIWATLTDEKSGEMLLSGKSAARLLDAHREATKVVNLARGQEARFSSVVPMQRDQPALTRFQLYWETIENVLADRPLTILDPQSGRTHLYLADPERFNINLMNAATAFGPEAPPTGETVNGTSAKER